MGLLLQDLRYGLRMIRRNPGFAAAAIIALALGIGANTAMFSVINAVLLRPLPFPEPDRLVRVWTLRGKGANQAPLSYPDFTGYKADNHVFESMAVYRSYPFTLSDAGGALRVDGIAASPELFSVLGASPALGRNFLPEEYVTSAATPSVIISNELWERRFNRDPNVLGQSLELNSRKYMIVAVMPKGFQFPVQPEAVDLWTTISADSKPGSLSAQRGAHYLQSIARLKKGVTISQAQAEMNTIARRLAQEFPGTNADSGIRLIPEFDHLVNNVRLALIVLFGATTMVLLIVCVNVANLLIARAMARHNEIAVRIALGAGRMRVVRQMLTESVLLAVIGGTLGVILAAKGTGALIALSPAGVPRIAQVAVDGRVLLFTLVVSLGVAILFGLIPAFRLSATGPFESMRQAGRSSTEVVENRRIVSALVVSEVALAMVLLVGAGLLIQSLMRLTTVNPGFRPNKVLSFRISLPRLRYPAEQQTVFFEGLRDRLKNSPGVRSVAAVYPLPLSGDDLAVGFDIERHPVAAANQPVATTYVVTPDYFKTMGIPLLEGRDFAVADSAKAGPVVIINQTLARQFFPDENPIGRRIRPGISATQDLPMREIVGVVGDVRSQSLSKGSIPEVYVPVAQLPMNALALVLSGEEDPRAMTGAVREQVKALDKELPVYGVRTMDQYLSLSLTQPRFNSVLLGVLALLALVLTAIGLYGVMAQMVAQRRREMSIRLALGAQRRDVLKLIVTHGMVLAGIGVCLGAAGAFWASRLLSSSLFGVGTTDPLTFVGVSAVLIGVGFLGSYMPARSVTSLDPAEALRQE